MTDWLEIHRGPAPLLVAFPHTGTDLADMKGAFASPWLARRDADWWVDQLYGFARELGATTVRTRISRSVIDVNRDPSGASLYPGQNTTGLCPETTFDGEPLYDGTPPGADEITRRRALWFDPYHAALAAELERLRHDHPRVVLYDAHSIRSRIPHLFDGELPVFNLGTNLGTTCDPALEQAIAGLCAESGLPYVVNGRFRGGWTTRHYGRPAEGLHAVQMELAIRAYMDEPAAPDEANWPPPFAPEHAGALVAHLTRILMACLAFART